MARTKFVCKLLFYLTRLAGILYAGAVLYSTVCLITGWSISSYGEGKFLHILFPFTQQPFLNIDNNTAYIIFSFLLPLTLYGIFFLLGSSVFKVFYQARLFTVNNLKQLNRFYLFNIIAPAIATVVSSFFVPVENVIWVLIAVHFILGIFIYLLAAIFKQGLHLQNEQDLFI